MPRKKGHGIPPTKRIKAEQNVAAKTTQKSSKVAEKDGGSNSVPSKNEMGKAGVETQVVTKSVNGGGGNGGGGSSSSDAEGGSSNGENNYLHKKFKKIAAAASADSNTALPITNGVDCASSNRPNDNEVQDESKVISGGRYMCPYCKLACAKPSVLEKHIRAHTNERPYPCVPCGFAFKTKSNLYKHCRSRAHAVKVGDAETDEPGKCHDLSGSDDDIGDAQARLTVTSTAMPPSTLQNISQADLQKKIDDRISKTIYKPKFHTTSLYVENTSQSPVSDLSVTSTAKESWSSDTATPTNTLSLNMPPVDRAALSENSVSSPFTSCSSPSPEFLHRHISKLISDNQAIVETMDPIWPKKFLHRSNSKEASHSPSSHFPSVVSDNVLSFKKTESSEVIPPFSNYSLLPEKRSENELNSHSKLALALLRPADNLEHNYRSPSPLMQDVCSDQQPLNLTTNSGKIGQTGNNSRKRSYSEGFPYGLKESELPPQSSIKLIKSATGFTRAVPAELNISLDSKTLHDKIMKHTMMSGSVMKDSTFKSNIPIGPHGMIVTDVISSRKSPLNYTTSNKSQSPEIRSICETCNASCRNAQELRIHQMYFCKWDESIGHDKPLNDPALTNTPTKGEGPVMIAPPFPSPGPLLGKTPLVDSYARSVSEHKIDKKSPFKKVKHDMDVKGESKPLSLLTTLRSLEELSRSPMKNNLHMFGGEVKILDNTSGEAKTLRIEPSNRGSQGSSEVTLDISSASGYKDKLNNNETGIAEEKSPQIVVNMAKTGFHSGGVVQVPHKIANSQEANHQRTLKSGTKDSSSSQVSTSNISNSKYPSSNKLIIPIIPNIVTPTLAVAGVASPVALPLAPFTPMLADKAIINPLTSITGYNPLTLPPAPLLCAASSDVAALSPIPAPYTGGIVTILHGGKAIPYVPGMPGPHTLLQTSPSPTTELPTNNKVIQHSKKDSISEPPPSDLKLQRSHSVPTSSDARKVLIPSIKLDSAESNNKALPDAKQSTAVKILNNRRNTISPISSSGSPVAEKPPPPPQPPQEEDAGSATNAATERRFLRPTSLPLKPGTFTPKKVGTPNVLPLVSPETPRPRKSYGQLYLNGHAYTYLGLKCSTRVFFCTLNKPQPIYVPLTPEHSNISMYSNWKIRSDADPNPFGLEPGQAMAHYDSRHRPTSYTVALSNKFEAVTHSSQWKYRPLTEKPLQIEPANKLDSPEEKNESLKENTPKRIKIFDGGFESNEDYIYVRGRGRGRYVCEICGIRCKKPSMLKKHIRIHTDVRPFTCKHCNFSFKTKGNLTKHMKSKAHFKKCSELGVEPVPTWVDDSHIDAELLARQQAMRADRGLDPNLTDDDEDDDEEDEDDDDEDVDVDVDGDDDDYEDDCNSRLEQDAVRSLLSLSEGPPSTSLQSSVVRAGLVATHGRPHTYPYSHPVPPAAPPASPHGTHEPQTPTLSAISAQREREKVSQNTGLARVHPDEPPAQVERSEAGVGVTSRYYFPSTRNSNSSLPQDKTKTSPDAPTSESASNNETEPHKISATSFPMDLSYKSSDETRARTCEAALLLASLCSTVDALPTTPTPVADVSEDSQLLQAYLTERAVKQQHIKQHQYHRPPQGGSMLFTSTASIQTPTDKPLNPADVIPQPSSEKSKFLSSTKSPNFHVESLIRPTPPPPPPPVSEPNDEEESDKESTSSVVARKADTNEKEMVDASDEARKSPPLDAPPSKRPKAEFIPPSNGPPPNYVSVLEDGRSMCLICNKLFTKPSQLWLHVNIHYFERPFRCESCAVSFRTKGHLQKHQRSVTHMNKMSMNSTFGTATTSNPRPFKCDDCKIAFRIHGHLAKHLRSKMHIMKLECLGKLPFGTYAEMERSGINMNDIDTTDCDNSLESLQLLAQKLIEKDPSKLGQWDPLIQRSMSTGETSSEDEDAPAAVLAKTILAGVPRPSGHHDASYKGPSSKSTDSNSTTVISSSSDALSHTPKTDSVKTVIQRGSQLILREPNNREESSAASGSSPFPVHSFGNSILLRAPSSNSVLGPTTGTGSYSQQLGKITTKLLMNSSQVSERTRDSTVVSAIKSKVETNSEKNCS